jgi:hypothetical protein
MTLLEEQKEWSGRSRENVRPRIVEAHETYTTIKLPGWDFQQWER